jgi:hypothetical protein
MKLTHDQIVAGLVERGVPQHVAQGVAMNFRDESGLDTGINERGMSFGQGGYGLAQWTGPRRIQLEDFAKSQGKPVDDPNVQMDFFMRENAGPEKGAWNAVVNSPDARSAAVSFVKNWERPTSANVAARSAKYLGDSPSESGGARFGGTGLGTPGLAPLTPPTPPAPVPESPMQKLGDNFSSAVAGYGSGAINPLPSSTVPRIPMALTQAQQVATADTATPEAMRAQLAQRLALLNSGKLWG